MGTNFRFSSDLIIHSHVTQYYSVALRINRILTIYVRNDGFLFFASLPVFVVFGIDVNTWYNILFERKIKMNRQVREPFKVENKFLKKDAFFTWVGGGSEVKKTLFILNV